MSILLGNLSIQEIESRVGVEFPETAKDYMAPRKQEEAQHIRPGSWHCFDIPFTLLCGDRETAQAVYDHLSPIASQFKEPLQVAIS